VARLEKYTRYATTSRPGSTQRRRRAQHRVDDETAALLDYAGTAWAASEGRFDLTSGILRAGLPLGPAPRARRHQALLPRVGWQRVRWKRRAWCSRERAWARLRRAREGVRGDRAAGSAGSSARPLVDLSGDLAIRGSRGRTPLGRRRPQPVRRGRAAHFTCRGGVATSGDTERCMVIDGTIRASSTARALAGGGPAAVTVLASLSPAASTLAMLRGREGDRLARRRAHSRTSASIPTAACAWCGQVGPSWRRWAEAK
jgi:thiamine biosynthesis lipoprotein